MKYFETDRLRVQELSMQELDGFYAMRSDPNVTKHYFASPMTLEQSKAKLQSLVDDIPANQSYSYVLLRKEDHQFIGTICLWNLQPDIKTGELGYESLPEFWRNGYMKEVLPAFITHMHTVYGYEIFTACPSSDNQASNRLLLSSGFEFKNQFDEDNHTLNFYIYKMK
jgi:ribosomal-protein-alanine N-acetyltransferase